MRKSYLFYCLLFLVNFILSETNAQQIFRTTPTSVIGYLEYLPQDYSSNSDKYPIVIFLHGLGERGSTSNIPADIEKTISLVAKHGPAKYVKNGTQFPFILISPQLKSNLGGWPTSYVNEVINYCRTYLRIDERRIYLTGLSLGGGGTWSTAQDFPKTFAAIAPVCGSNNSISKACNIAGENLPVWAFHGNSDTTVPLSRTVNMINAINACTPAPSPLAKISIYPGVNHNSWDNAYLTDHSVHNPNVYEWMLSFTNTTNGTNKIPLANAGSDVNLTLPNNSVTIAGSGSDSDGSISAYSWSQMSGPLAATLLNASTASLTASNLSTGVYVFKLKVTDNGGDSSTDYVKVTIQQAPNNVAPVANAGADATLILPVNSIVLEGSGSDSDGTITSYTWAEVSGPAAALSGTSSSTLTASTLIAGAYIFRLTVIDNLGSAKTDDVSVMVRTSANASPVISAGTDRTIKLPSAPVTLFGVASDEDGTIASCLWVKVSGGSCTFTSTTALRPKLSNLSSGTYIFKLTVTDNDGASVSDEVTYFADIPPVANAGGDYNISLPTNTVTLNGSATDDDGTIASYVWVKESGAAATLTNRYAATLGVSGMSVGTYVFKLTVTDNANVQSIDYATVIVSSSLVSGRSIASETEQESGISSSAFVLSDSTIDFKNSHAIVYNESGIKIYDGEWNAFFYNDIFKSGLYYYKIIKAGGNISGKVYKTESF